MSSTTTARWVIGDKKYHLQDGFRYGTLCGQWLGPQEPLHTVTPHEDHQCKTCVSVFKKRVIGGYYSNNPEPAFDPWDYESEDERRDY